MSSIKNLLKFEPVASLAGLQVILQAVLGLLTKANDWDLAIYGSIQGIQAAVFAFLATFVRGSVIPTAKFDELAKLTPEELTQLALDQLPKG